MAFKLLYRDVVRTHGQPDVIHAHFTDIAAMAAKLANSYNRPFVVTEHNSLINKEILNDRTLYFANHSYKHADRLIAVSSRMAGRIQFHFKKICMLIPNIVDVSAFSFNPAIHYGFHFVSVGSLIQGKGFDTLIRAFSKLHREDVKLTIIGDGSERDELEKMVAGLGLEDYVVIAGHKNRDEINTTMNQSDAFVLASKSETFGVVYIEAMAVGLPVIATRCGGPEDFVNEHNGILVDVDDEKQLTQAMTKMVHTINHYDKRQISRDCIRNFAPPVIAEKLGVVYNELIGPS